MTEISMSTSGVGKVFYGFKHEILRVLKWLSFDVPIETEKWVLKDISFDVPKGQALAIVGRNGAGKSTLLKVITGTMRASTGDVHINGKISAILELGMGFNPDLSGRDNAFHSLGLMGHQHDEIIGVMKTLEAFSELGDYFDQPLRIYSSGMHMRLAFSVATAFRPEVLIVDEALSVGDSYFQHKSFDKIKEFQKLGTTLILVSHDRMAVLNLCDRAILLHEGKIAIDGDPESVLDYYNALLAHKDGEEIKTNKLDDGRIQTISGSRKVTVENSSLMNASGKIIDTIDVGEELHLKVSVLVHEDVDQLVLGFAIKDRFGQTVFGANTFYSKQTLTNVKAGETYEFNVLVQADLGVGTYSIALALVGGESHLGENYEWRDLSTIFSVANLSETPFDGFVFLRPQISVKKT